MKVIYVMENKVNKKKYVGQTNNFQIRMNGHRSDANNPNSRSYKTPLSNAIRKYGWGQFNNYIIEEMPDSAPYDYVDEREKYFIKYFDSLSKNKGYNITSGGQGCLKPNLSYEEKLNKSKIFTPKEIKDIQKLLIEGIPTKDILKKYESRLTESFLYNINAGLNFKNDDWNYPLHVYKNDIKFERSPEEMYEIQQDIISGITYKEISNKWNISVGMISLINNGKQWYNNNLNYPLCIKGSSKLHNLNTWVKNVQKDLMNSDLELTEIAKKYQKAYSTIKKINSGSSHRNNNYKYPLTSNRT